MKEKAANQKLVSRFFRQKEDVYEVFLKKGLAVLFACTFVSVPLIIL